MEVLLILILIGLLWPNLGRSIVILFGVIFATLVVLAVAFPRP